MNFTVASKPEATFFVATRGVFFYNSNDENMKTEKDMSMEIFTSIERSQKLETAFSVFVKSIVNECLGEVKREILDIQKAQIRKEEKRNPDPEVYMTRKEVMALLKRCDSTMTKWSRRGYLVPKSIGGKYLYKKSDVMKLVK